MSLAPTNSDVLPYGRMNALTSVCGPRRVVSQQMRAAAARGPRVEFAQPELDREQVVRDGADAALEILRNRSDASGSRPHPERRKSYRPTRRRRGAGPPLGRVPPGAGVAPASTP